MTYAEETKQAKPNQRLLKYKGLKIVPCGHPVQQDFPSGQVTFHFDFPDGQGIRSLSAC